MISQQVALFVLSFLFCLTGYSKAPKYDPNAGNQYLANYINSFDSIGALMDEFQLLGIFSAQDKEEVLKNLTKLGVSPQQKLSFVKTNGRTMTFGKTASLTTEAINRIKIGSGQFISIKSNMTMAERFQYVVNLQLGRKTSSLFSLVLPTAHADAYANAANAIDAVTSTAGYFLKVLIGIFVIDPTNATLGVASFASGGVSEFSMWLIREWILKGDVSCNGDRYTAIGFSKTSSPLEYWKSSSEFTTYDCKKKIRDKDWEELIETGKAESLCRLISASYDYIHDVFEEKRGYYVIKQATLKQHLGEPVPPCTEALAQTLTNKLKSQLKSELDKVIKEKQPSQIIESKPSKSYQ